MAVRCPHCDVVLTEAEARPGICPECATPMSGDPVPLPAAAPPARGRSRFTFPAGLVVGVLLTAAGAGGAWRAVGRAPNPTGDAAGGEGDRSGCRTGRHPRGFPEVLSSRTFSALFVAADYRSDLSRSGGIDAGRLEDRLSRRPTTTP